VVMLAGINCRCRVCGWWRIAGRRCRLIQPCKSGSRSGIGRAGGIMRYRRRVRITDSLRMRTQQSRLDQELEAVLLDEIIRLISVTLAAHPDCCV
jgi:hypothetical protein